MRDQSNDPSHYERVLYHTATSHSYLVLWRHVLSCFKTFLRLIDFIYEIHISRTSTCDDHITLKHCVILFQSQCCGHKSACIIRNWSENSAGPEIITDILYRRWSLPVFRFEVHCMFWCLHLNCFVLVFVLKDIFINSFISMRNNRSVSTVK